MVMIKPRKARWTGHVTRTRERISTSRALVENPERKNTIRSLELDETVLQY
jgi:hypothetical protein